MEDTKQKEISLSAEQLEGKNVLYILTKRKGLKEFCCINIEDLEHIQLTFDKTIALEFFNEE